MLSENYSYNGFAIYLKLLHGSWLFQMCEGACSHFKPHHIPVEGSHIL